MYIGILQGDEIENEINVNMHCSDCALYDHNFSHEQYKFVKQFVDKNMPVPVPMEVSDKITFINYIKSMKL